MDVVKAFGDDLEIKAIPHYEEQDGGVEVQQMVVAVLASLQSIASDVNGMSPAIGDVNRRKSNFKSVLRAGGKIVAPNVRWQEGSTSR